MIRRKILLVEDNPQDEKLTLRALQKLQVVNEIDVVRDGSEALDYLWRRGAYANRVGQALPAVVLLDIKLPKLSGIDVLMQLRNDETTHTLPVVMLTSSDEEQDIADSYRNGANSYVRKPVNAGEFAEAVARLGLYWLALNELPGD
ncbi:MAG: response regulator [Gammaproteobacteria bacterium]|nr:response regulator [Gammaproteobacteria bacterium]